MYKLYRYLFLFFLALVNSEALSLEEGLIEAIEKSPELQEQRSLFREVSEDKDLSISGWMPSVALVAEHQYLNVENGNFPEQTVDSSSIEIKQNLFKGFADINRYQLETARLNSARFKVSLERNSRSLEYIENYINVLRNRDFLKISQMSLNNRIHVYKKIKKKVDVGFGRQLEHRHAKSSLDLARLTFRVQQRNSSQELIKFSKLLSREITIEELENIEEVFCMPQSFDSLYKVVKNNNPSLKVSKTNIDVVQQEYETSNAGYWPTVDFKADYYFSHAISNVPQNNNYEYTVTFNYNIFNGLADRNKQEKQKRRLEQKSALLRKTQRDLKNRVQLAWFSYELNRDKYSFSQVNVQSKRDALFSYDYEFLLGRASLNAMLNATEDYYNALKDMTDAYYDLLLDYYRIVETTGLLYEVITKQINLPFSCNNGAKLDVKLLIEEVAQEDIQGFKSVQNCFKVLKNKIYIYKKATVKSSKMGFLIKNTIFCSQVKKGQWMKVEKGWIDKNDIEAISIQY